MEDSGVILHVANLEYRNVPVMHENSAVKFHL